MSPELDSYDPLRKKDVDFLFQEVNLNKIAALAREGRIDTSQLITMKTLKVRTSSHPQSGCIEGRKSPLQARIGNVLNITVRKLECICLAAPPEFYSI